MMTFELAEELGIDVSACIALCNAAGLNVRSGLDHVSAAQVAAVKLFRSIQSTVRTVTPNALSTEERDEWIASGSTTTPTDPTPPTTTSPRPSSPYAGTRSTNLKPHSDWTTKRVPLTLSLAGTLTAMGCAARSGQPSLRASRVSKSPRRMTTEKVPVTGLSGWLPLG